MKNILNILLILFIGTQMSYGQIVNSASLHPNSPTSTDTILVISDFSYFGNCTVGLVNYTTNQTNFVIDIHPEYCGYGDSTWCNVIDTFSLGVLPVGNYTINIEYHQGTVCGGSFDTIIETHSTTLEIGSLSILEFTEELKQVVRVVDLMGREVQEKPNVVLIYLYNDGTTEKVFRVE
jgi:hypothetical protein